MPYHPMRIDEGPPATMPDNHAFVRKLCESAVDGGSAYPVSATEFELGWQLSVRTEISSENGFDKMRFQLCKDRDRLTRINR